MIYEAHIASSLEKIFPDQYIPTDHLPVSSALRGETFSFQVALYSPNPDASEFASISVNSTLHPYIRLREVLLVPAAFPCNAYADDDFLRKEPGLFPDLLRDLDERGIQFISCQWRALWVDIEITRKTPAGQHHIELTFAINEKEICCTETVLNILDITLPEQKLLQTRWFYTNCLSDYYQVPMYSEKHWEIIENFISLYVKRGMNMLLTPIHTPPLDTAVGHYLPSTQLVDIEVENNTYHFQFTKLKRWVDIALRCGIKKFEMAHLFTQWGAKTAPMIIAKVDGVEKRIFGWDTPATDPVFVNFLKSYLGELTAVLREWGIAEHCCFHISDEPSKEHLENYKAAKSCVEGILKDFKIMDALSNYDFYKTGTVSLPVCASDHISEFLENKVKPLWTYYCCSQQVDVANQFIAMPSRRNRIIGIQLYKFEIEGFLHWGFNFYNSQYSIKKINPYEITDAQNAFPAGDPFLVYPGKDGIPEDSIRSMIASQAMYDLRALQLLEEKIGRSQVLKLIDHEMEITFSSYPRTDEYINDLRNRIHELLVV